MPDLAGLADAPGVTIPRSPQYSAVGSLVVALRVRRFPNMRDWLARARHRAVIGVAAF